MYEACSNSGFLSLQDLFLLAPIQSAIELLVLGAIFWALWSRLKGRRKLYLVPAVVAVGLVVLAEPADLWKKRAAALEIAQTAGEWQANPAFELRNSAQKVWAFRTKLGSKCRSGFLVKTERPMSSNEDGFAGTVPSSPASYRNDEVRSFVGGARNHCFWRAEVMWGERRKDHPDACSKPEPRLLFFSTSLSDPNGFEMRWCSRLTDNFAYCEADSREVALASGLRF